MTSDSAHEIIAALDELLEEERAALLKGDLETVSQLLDSKTELIERLSRLELESAALTTLDGKVRRNQALLEQAAAGIRKVAARLAELRQVRATLDTYTQRGTRERVELGPDSSVERRA
ncbi:flagellar export chaperone FlgN [Sulfitobacter sp. D35]|uniref:flagellar export chaperone FlgN n=1 Tax=Sulfitobacter sp. D35 TaxID=3083252 RepID=UPI00296E5317|nr:flagellar export chaperone FlgN [Sulfitobacter sp. D35]MDW4498258.1 flagellar export chaperone FlgN [Sulfitobacter sp. D35]